MLEGQKLPYKITERTYNIAVEKHNLNVGKCIVTSTILLEVRMFFQKLSKTPAHYFLKFYIHQFVIIYSILDLEVRKDRMDVTREPVRTV